MDLLMENWFSLLFHKLKYFSELVKARRITPYLTILLPYCKGDLNTENPFRPKFSKLSMIKSSSTNEVNSFHYYFHYILYS